MAFEQAEYIEMDASGRIVIPKSIRKKMKGSKLEIRYDEEHNDIHLVPVKSIDEIFGAFKGIKKGFEKFHEEDWREHPDR